MRFKKLRIFVGISFIIFILIASNIILFGELAKKKLLDKNSSDQNILVDVDNKKSNFQGTTVVNQSKSDDQSSGDSSASPEPIVVRPHRRRSRAS